jgi:hypothetical protein
MIKKKSKKQQFILCIFTCFLTITILCSGFIVKSAHASIATTITPPGDSKDNGDENPGYDNPRTGRPGTTTPYIPHHYSVLINGGDDCTSNQNVILTLDARDATKVRIGNSPDFSGSQWQPFNIHAVVSWPLDPTPGIHTVYVQYMSAHDNVSTIISDSIEFNTECGVEPLEPDLIEEEPIVEEKIEEKVEEVVGVQANEEKVECTVDCNLVSYGIYIINPDGTERHMNSNFVQTEDLGNGITLYKFEDKSDFDFNDVILEVKKSDCQVEVTSRPLEARWHHQVRVKLLYDGVVKEDIMLWTDSHQSINSSKMVKLTEC